MECGLLSAVEKRGQVTNSECHLDRHWYGQRHRKRERVQTPLGSAAGSVISSANNVKTSKLPPDSSSIKSLLFLKKSWRKINTNKGHILHSWNDVVSFAIFLGGFWALSIWKVVPNT